MKSIFTTTRLTLMALLLLSVSAFGQVPASGATDVAITTNYTIPAGAPGLVDGTIYDLVVLNGTSTVQIGVATTFTYVAATGNTVAGPTLINYSDYNWRIILTGENAVTPPSGVKYGSYSFTTIGPTVTLTISGGSTIAEDGGTTNLLVTASAAIGKDLAVTVTYTGTVDNSLYGTDFTNTGGANPETITILAGNLTQPTTLTGVADAFLEGDETIIGTITAVASGVIGGSAQTVTITDAESLILTGGATIAEDGGTATLTATVSGGGTLKLNGGGNLAITLTYTGTTDAVYGTDFTNSGGADPETLTLLASGSSVFTTVTGVADSYLEGDETAVAAMTTGVTGLTIGGSPQTITITDAESLILSGGTTIDEATPATLTATVSGGGTLNLNGGGNLAITLTYTGTTDAVYGTDFTNSGGANPETLTLLASSSSVLTTITPVNDATVELDETAIAAMTTGVTGLTISGSPQTVIITDDAETVLTSPADAATSQALNVTLAWNAVAGADQYKLYVNTNNTFTGTAIINGVDQGNVTSKAPGGLSDNVTYYWKVIPRNTSSSDTRAASNTEVRSFTTSQQSVTGISPADNAYDVSLSPTLSWPATTGADKYRLEVNTASNFAGTVIFDNSSLTTTSQALSGLTYNTIYYWRVTASSNLLGASSGKGGISTSSTSQFTTLLATPQLTSPADNYSSADRTPTLTWTQAANTTGVTYQLDYYFNGSGTPAGTVTGLTSTSYTFPSDLPLGRYTWKITADDGAGKNTPTVSAIRTFDVVPTLVSPVNGLTGVPIEPAFTWEAGGINTYIIQITTTSGDYSSPVVEKTVTGSNPTTYQMLETDTGMPLNNNTVYYWRLKITSGTGYIYSGEWQFKTWPNMTITHGWPTSGATVYTTSTTFSWAINAATGTMKYKPQVVASTTTPTTTGWAAATLTTTTTSLTTSFSLNGGTQYYWRLVVLNSSSQVVAYSTPTTFTTSGGATVNLYPSWPTGGATVYSTTPMAYWYLDVYATGLTYQIRYATDAAVTSGELSHTSAANYPTSTGSFSSNQYITFPTLTAGTTYYWQVRAYYATTTSYSSWSSVESFTVNNTNAVVIPTPSYPTGGVTVYTSSPYLYWYLGTNATGLTYEIDYALTGTGVDGTADQTGITNLYYQLSGLTAGSTYEWRVRSNNGSTTSNWSSTVTFVVDGGVSSSSAVASWPTGNPTVYSTKPTLSWYLNGSSSGITGYKVKYSTTDPGSSSAWNSLNPGTPDATDGEVTISGSSTTTWTATADLTYGQKYYWAVASWDGSSAGTYSSDSFTIVGGSTAGTPILSSPIGGVTVYSSSQTLYWYFNGTTTGIQSYDIHYSKDGFLTTNVNTSSTTTSVSLTGLTPGATYSWKVRAFYGGSTYGSYSSTETFVIDAGAAPVQPLIGGPNNVTITTSSPVVSWVLPVQSESNLSYELVYSTSEDMSSVQTIEGIQSPFAPIDGLEAGKTYYWKVRSKTNSGNYSDYSTRASFSTDQTTEVKEETVIPDKFVVDQNYPNPFNPSTIIKFGIPNGEFVSVRIYNMLGQEVRTLVSGNMNAGTYELTWNGKDNSGNSVTSGAYIYRIVAGNNAVTKKMMLLK